MKSNVPNPDTQTDDKMIIQSRNPCPRKVGSTFQHLCSHAFCQMTLHHDETITHLIVSSDSQNVDTQMYPMHDKQLKRFSLLCVVFLSYDEEVHRIEQEARYDWTT